MTKLLLLIILLSTNFLFGESHIKFNTIVPNQNSKVSFSNLKDFALDKNGNYYFLDNDLKKVYVFDKQGNSIKRIPNSTPNFLHNPIAIQVTNDGEIVILDAGSNKVIFYDSTGNFIRYFGDDNGELGSFDSPIDFKIDSQKNIYVLDSGNEFLLKYNSNGLFRSYFKTKNPIAFDVSKNGNIYLLQNSNDLFTLSILSPKFQLIKTIRLNMMRNCSDIAVSDYGDCYVVDSELGGAFHIDITKSKIGEQFGVKSSSKGRQQFNNPVKIKCININAQSDRIFIMDDKFNQVQSFDNSVDSNKSLEKSSLPSFDIKIVDNLNNYSYKDIIFDNDSLYYISPVNAIVKVVNNKIIYSIDKNHFANNGITFSEPVAITKLGRELFIVDKGLNKVIVLNSYDGSYNFSFGESGSANGKFDSPSDISVDKLGRIVITDTENRRLQIFSADGLFIKQISLQSFYPVKISFNSKGDSYILPKSGNIILKMDFRNSKITPIDLKQFYPLEEFNLTILEVVKNDLVLVYNQNTGVADLLKDDKPFARFFSRGKGVTEIEDVSGFGFNSKSNQMFFYNYNSKQNRVLQMFFAPKTPTNIRMDLNDKGKLKLMWSGSGKNTAHYTIFRKTDGIDSLKYFAITKDTSVYIGKLTTKFIYSYVVQAVSKHDFRSNYSEQVADKYSYYQFLKSTNPIDAIKKLTSIKELNSKVINNQIYNIYKTLIGEAKSKKDYDTALQYYDKMKKVEPNEPEIYLQKSSLLKHLQKFDEGIVELTKAIKLFPNNIRIWTKLINLQFVKKDYQGIVQTCENALKIFPNNEILLYNLAQSSVMLSSYSKAISIYRDLALTTGKERYFLKAGEVLIKVDSINAAIELYQQAENTGILNSKMYNAMGEALLLKGDYKNAVFELGKSIEMDSTNANTFYLLGKANAKNRDIISAIKAFKKSTYLDSLNPAVFFELGKNLELINRRKQAIKAYEKTIALDPNNIEATYSLGKLYLTLKMADSAVRELDQAIKIFPDSKKIKQLYKKALTARIKLNSKRPPIEFSKISFDEIFPSLINYYNTHSIGMVTIFNTKNNVFEDVKIEIDSPDLLVHKAEINVPVLLPNDYSKNLISLQLKNDLIKVSTDGEKQFPITLTVYYNYKGKQKKLTKNKKILLHSLNAIRWDDKRHLASFINPLDKVIREFVTNGILSKFNDINNSFSDIPEAIVQAAEMWEYIKDINIAYVQDPNTSYAKISLTNAVDYVQFAQQTLKVKSGDCDDLVTLFSNLFESAGIETAYIDVPGHVFLAFNSGIEPSKLSSTGLSNKDVVVKFNKVWIPIETTVIGNNNFLESWSYAIKKYKNELSQEHNVELIQINKAAQTFPPITYPKTDSLDIVVNTDTVKKSIIKDLTVLSEDKNKFTEMHYWDVLKKYPDNIFNLNSLGLFYYRTNNIKKSEMLFKHVLSIDSNNVIALNNLGNLYFLNKNFEPAEHYYLKCYNLDSSNAGLVLNIIRVELNLKKLKEAELYYQKLTKINPELAAKYDYLKTKFAQKFKTPLK